MQKLFNQNWPTKIHMFLFTSTVTFAHNKTVQLQLLTETARSQLHAASITSTGEQSPYTLSWTENLTLFYIYRNILLVELLTVWKAINHSWDLDLRMLSPRVIFTNELEGEGFLIHPLLRFLRFPPTSSDSSSPPMVEVHLLIHNQIQDQL